MAATYVPSLLSELGGTVSTSQIGTGTPAAGKYVDGGTGAWTALPGGGGGAPTDATYIVQTASGSLSAEQALSALATGLLKVTTTTGVLSTAVAGTDYLAPNGSGAALTALNAGSLATGTVPTARLATGTADATTFHRGDGTWAVPAGGGLPTFTSGRVPYATTGGVLTDSANLTYAGADLVVGAGKVRATDGGYTTQIGGDNSFGAFCAGSANGAPGFSFTNAGDILPISVVTTTLGLTPNSVAFGRASFRFKTYFGNAGDFQVVAASDVPLVAAGAASQTANIAEWRKSDATVYATVSENGYFTTRKNSAPADAELIAGEAAFWLDSTNGAARFMIKAKQADGTVRTGQVALT